MTPKIIEDTRGMSPAASSAVSKCDQVRSVFENTPRYLSTRGVDVRVRMQIVKELAAAIRWHQLLDVGCGDGSISLPLVRHDCHLTLLDLSSSMAARTRSNVPEGFADNVDIQNENFMSATFDEQSFDLIVSVGVLAHVDSPDAFIAKLARLLRPGGSLIIEFTDCRHAVGVIGRFFGRLKEVVAPAKYATNRLSFSEVTPLFAKHHLKLQSVFRYSRLPLPGIERPSTHGVHHKLVSLTFGHSGNNRMAWLGNEYICLLTSD
jgi:2-polyprenyl-3-methyl-5-hydroxy-6-metoxy-1,4-benzoquinol methylase